MQQAGGHIPPCPSIPAFWLLGGGDVHMWQQPNPAGFAPELVPTFQAQLGWGHSHLAAMCDWSCSLLRQTMSWMLSV